MRLTSLASITSVAVAITACGRVGYEFPKDVGVRDTGAVPDAGPIDADLDDADLDDADLDDADLGDAAMLDAAEYPCLFDDAGVVLSAPGTEDAYDLSCADTHTCVVNRGELWCAGRNDMGELGAGDCTNHRVPVRVRPDITDFVAVESGRATCALRANGRVYCSSPHVEGEPVIIYLREVPLPRPARSISLHFGTVCAVLDDSSLYCWGSNAEGELAMGELGFRTPPAFLSTPTPLLTGESVVGASAGLGHACAATVDGRMLCWGSNVAFELGDPSFVAMQSRTPRLMPSAEQWIDARSGQAQTLGLTSDRRLFGWGDDEDIDGHPGALGLAGTAIHGSPTQLPLVGAVQVFAIHSFHGCAVLEGNALWCWGRNLEGQFGMGDNALRPEPVQVASDVEDVCVGRFYTCIRRTDHSVHCAGDNPLGAQGTGDEMRSHVFVPTLFL